MNMKKRLMVTGLSAAMMLSALAPAASVAADDMTTVSLYIPILATYTEDAIAEVETAMNEYLAENYGIQVDLHYTEFGNHTNVVNLAMTTDELDIACFFSDSLSSYVKNGQLLDITDYFENATGDIKDTFTDVEISSCTYEGRLWAFPRKYQYGGNGAVVMNAEIVEELGIDPQSVTNMDSLGEVLYQVHEAHPEIYALVPQSAADMTWARPFEQDVANTNFLALEKNTGSTQLSSIFELEQYQKFCSYMSQWYQDGLIMSDAVSNTMEGTTLITAGNAFACIHNGDIDPLEKLYPGTVVSPVLEEEWAQPYAGGADIGNLKYGISANSAHQEEAFTLLQAIYTDADLITLLMYGIEGEHWVYNADGRADYPEGMTAENEPYGGIVASATYPNYVLAPVKATSLVDDYVTAIDEWDASVKVSPIFGFSFDVTEHTDFMTAYENLEQKYLNPTFTGTVSLEEMLPTIQSELDAIGYYEVLEEAQAQFDAFLAEQQ